MSETIHIEIYLKDENNSPYIAYEVLDNDPCILFSTELLYECLLNFTEDIEEIIYIHPFIIKERLENFKKNIFQLDDSIIYKIECIIKFIKKNTNKYLGIKTIFNYG